MIDDVLLYLSVRIEEDVGEEKNEILGSGVWWKPETYSEYMYIFTAAHVVKQKKKIVVRYRDKDEKEKTVNIDKNDIACHKDANFGENILPYKDVAILRCKKIDLNLNITYTYKINGLDNLSANRNLIFRGYPDSLHQESSFNLSSKPAYGVLETPDRPDNRFGYRLNSELGIKEFESNGQITGFSGAGMFLNDNSELILLGIHSNSLGEDVALNTCSGMEAKLLIDICNDNNWDIPDEIGNVNGELFDAVRNFRSEIKNDCLDEIMREIINNNFEELIKSDFCGISKECEKKNCHYECQTFRNNLLIILCILKYINKSEEFSKLKFSEQQKLTPIKYICCDGQADMDRVNLPNFIESLKTDYLKRNKVDDFTLVLWGIKKGIKGKEKCCTAERFKKIIRDIKEPYDSLSKFDIKKGLTQAQKLSVISITELIDNIEEDKLEDMIDVIKTNIQN
ncbi:hypothetical protein [Clostridium butyricum]